MADKKKKTSSKRFGNPARNAEYQDKEARLHGATLPENDSKLFFKLFMPLLAFTDQKLGVFESERITVGDKKVITDYHRTLMRVSDELWQHLPFIDEFIADTDEENLRDGKPAMPEAHKELLCSWKRTVRSKFAVVRHKKNGSVLVDMNTGKVYFVKGINDTIEQLVSGFPLPVVIKTALMPYKDVIISSGHVGLAYTENAGNSESIYQEAKENGTIITKL